MNLPNLGIQNRNPLNIRYSRANRWLGLDAARPNVKGFCRFVSFAHGYRAAIVLAKNYILRHGCNTPESIITRWAPPSENNTKIYVACVCGRSGLDAHEVIAPDSFQLMQLLAAMARQESGVRVTPEYLNELRKKFGV